MTTIIYIFLGGGLGSASRYMLSGFVYRLIGSDFPYGTYIVNLLGCFAIGLLMQAFQEQFIVNPSLKLFLTIGVLGGFTTFSTFSYETVMLLQDAEFLYAGFNILLSIITCLGATYVGLFLGKML